MRRVVQSIGAVFALIAFTLLLVAVLTSQWLVIDVDRETYSSQIGGGLASYSRYRGLYQECWNEKTIQTVIETNVYYRQNLCIYQDLRVLNIRISQTYSEQYKARAGQLVAMWAVIGLAEFLTFTALVLYVYSCCKHVNTYQWKYSSKAAAGLMLASMLSNGLGMGLFHGAEYMEVNEVKDAAGVQAPYANFFPQDMSSALRQATTRMYGYSYALSWCAVACSFLASILFMSISCCHVKSKPRKTVISTKSTKQINVVLGQRNPAYEMVQEQVILAPPKVYVVQDDYYGNSQGTYDPYRNGQPQNGYSPQYNYDRGWAMQ